VIPDELISDIRDRTDIVALIGEFVELKQRGQNFVGLCPFHNEKSPSFNVRRDRQFFHCFGCKESGDSIAFLMRLEGLTFPQAARALAERVGIEVAESNDREDEQKRRDRVRDERLLAVMEASTAFYFKQRTQHALAEHPAAELARRAVTDKTAETFRLGYAPLAWDALVAHLTSAGHALADAETLGLVMRRRDGSGYYDRFRHRLMFPITDLHGRVVAFSGRILPMPDGREPTTRDHEEPKYVNSPEHPLYKKGELLFGLHQARVEIRRNGWAVLCEGNFDLVALHQAGVQNVVAPLGTAFTEAQAKLLRRFAQRVTLMFGGDNAGRKAVQAAYPLLRKVELGGRVVRLPQGDDPDAYLRAHGAEGVARLLESASGIVEYLIDAAADSGGSSAEDRATAIQSLGPVLMAAQNPVEIELYIERICRRFGIADVRAVKDQLRRGVRGGSAAPVRQPAPTKSAPMSTTKLAGPPERVKLPQLQLDLLGALLDKPELFQSPHAENLEELLTAVPLRSIFSAAAAEFNEYGVLDASRLLAKLADNAALPELTAWLNESLSVEHYADRSKAEEVLQVGVPRLQREHVVKHELPQLMQQFREAKQRGDEELAREIMNRHDELTRSQVKGLKRV
jgi:DNA primase